MEENKNQAPAVTEAEKQEKAMLAIINIFIECGWTFKEAIDFLPEIEVVLTKMSVNCRITNN
ncbi:hypothetical protein [Bacillus cereus]|uniref:hypothetical protein n=1 Tax=Bacillus cereus group TaxID=86661 RepID=UPI000BF837E5|nr:hypothetical protein [Bacillus cereus]MCU5523033.1 hypothetical protein [Bacillus cereus]PEY32604.1 hypothetical protein CN347_21265 [Bacillus cereus]PFT88271.1 hypothetical protein COK66_26435 [Bacillus cereus]PGM15510.1 hypothetical protein CN935_00060 [Bacillus cereus]PGZ81380.1 hypothetical protein COE64_27020 [Bacillus cereus]